MSTAEPSTVAINARTRSIQPSATLAVSARAGELRAAGERVLNFAAGEPDFAPPKAVQSAVQEKLSSGPVSYAPVPGLPALREAAAKDLAAFHGKEFGASNILVTVGAKHALAELFLATLEPGDEVVIASPYWVSYPEQVRMAGGTPVIVRTDAKDNLKLSPAKLEAALSDKTRRQRLANIARAVFQIILFFPMLFVKACFKLSRRNCGDVMYTLARYRPKET